MTDGDVLALGREGLLTALVVLGPVMATALFIGLGIAIFQVGHAADRADSHVCAKAGGRRFRHRIGRAAHDDKAQWRSCGTALSQ